MYKPTPRTQPSQTTFVLIVLGSVAIFAGFVNWNYYRGRTGDLEYAKLQEFIKANEELKQAYLEQQEQITALQQQVHSKGSGRPSGSSKADKEEIARLTKALKQYEEQARIGASSTDKTWKELKLEEELQNYIKLHDDIMAGRKPPRFVQCVLLNGWGNVLQEAVSCFLYALVTKRAAIFNAEPLLGYMPFTTYIDPKKMPFDGYNLQAIRKYQEKVIPRHDLACLNYEQHHGHVELVTIHVTYDWYAPNMLINPHTGPALSEWLPKNYFQIIFDFLFKLRDDLQREVDDFKARHWSNFVVGIQIRNPSKTLKAKIDHKGFPVPDIDLFAEAAEDKAPYASVKWFVATQNMELIQYLKKSYGERIIYHNGTITTTFDSHAEGQRVSLLTWWLLGESDEIVTTEASSYGTTAGARRGLYPVVCNAHKFCHKRLSPTPCQDTHFPQDQPMECLKALKKYPHQFLTSPEMSCGWEKLEIYKSKEYQQAQKEGD